MSGSICVTSIVGKGQMFLHIFIGDFNVLFDELHWHLFAHLRVVSGTSITSLKNGFPILYFVSYFYIIFKFKGFQLLQ